MSLLFWAVAAVCLAATGASLVARARHAPVAIPMAGHGRLRPALERPVSTRIARTLVGAPDRRPYFEVLQRYADATGAAGLGNAFGDVDTLQGQHGANELQIAGLLARLHDPRERSQAATMLGTLILLYSSNGKAIGGGQLLQQALANYQSAIRSDSTNDAAKYDLELLLSLHSSQKRQRSQAQRTKPSEQGRGGRPATVKGNDY